MATVMPVKGSCWEGSGPWLLARVVGQAGSAVTQASLSSITCKVFDLQGAAPGTAVSEPTVTISSAVFDSLQTDARWTEDATGYNFAHQVASSVVADGGHAYRVEYKFTPASGQTFYVVFEVHASDVRSE